MTIDEYLKINKEFNYNLFITKVNNRFVKLFTSIMMDKLDEVKHFISKDVYDYANNILQSSKDKKQRKMYDELNVYNSKIIDIKIENDNHIIDVLITAKYLDYVIGYDDGKYIEGENENRVEVNYKLSFIKKSNTKNIELLRRCPSCGSSMDINKNGKCKYCGFIYNEKDYDWILSKIEKI